MTDPDLDLPEQVRLATERAAAAGFTMSCDPGAGRLLAVLAAAVPPGGRVLELGTGVGVGTAWIVHGLQGRHDVDVTTVERDPVTAQHAAAGGWPTWVRFINADALDVLQRLGTFDLIFADAQGGKWEGLGMTIAALRPGGQLLVDDMAPELFSDANYAHKTLQVRSRLLSRPDLINVEIAWSTGLILSTKRTA